MAVAACSRDVKPATAVENVQQQWPPLCQASNQARRTTSS